MSFDNDRKEVESKMAALKHDIREKLNAPSYILLVVDKKGRGASVMSNLERDNITRTLVDTLRSLFEAEAKVDA